MRDLSRRKQEASIAINDSTWNETSEIAYNKSPREAFSLSSLNTPLQTGLPFRATGLCFAQKRSF